MPNEPNKKFHILGEVFAKVFADRLSEESQSDTPERGSATPLASRGRRNAALRGGNKEDKDNQ